MFTPRPACRSPGNSQFEGCTDIGDVVVTEANKRGIFSVGIGDHGNELGFGTIYDAVVKTMPKARRAGHRGQDRRRGARDDVELGLLRHRGCLAFP